MFKNLFRNRLLIGALAFFVLCVGGSLLYQQHVYKETDKKLSETDEFQQWWKERHATPPSDATEPPKSEVVEAVETFASPVNAPSVDEAETENFPDFWSLSVEERQRIFDQFYIQHGLKPPPKGYEYVWKDEGVARLDEDGNPILLKKGDPWVEIKMGIGFAPTLEEYERYKQLREDHGWAVSRSEVAKAERLAAEIEAFEASVQRMRPISSSLSTFK
ncbi:hypothetical protein J5I95_17590 [Candidatus Poribacteria bacterium]|nr:hypothetical protein [Candidatus Poribacteria bacterium]